MNYPEVRLNIPAAHEPHQSTWAEALALGPLLVIQKVTGYHFIACLPSDESYPQNLHGIFLTGDAVDGSLDRWSQYKLTDRISSKAFTIIGRITI